MLSFNEKDSVIRNFKKGYNEWTHKMKHSSFTVLVIKFIVILATIVVLLGQGANIWAATPTQDPLRYDTNSYRLTASGEKLSYLLNDIQESAKLVGIDLSIESVGDVDAPVKGMFHEQSLPMLIKKLVRSVGFLLTQRDNCFTVYGVPEDGTPLSKNMSYVYELQALPVDVAMEQLQSFALDIQIRGLNQNCAISFVGPYEKIQEAVFFLETIDKESFVVMVELLIVQYRHGNKFNWGIDVTKGTYDRVGEANFAPGTQSTLGLSYSFLGSLDPSFAINLTNLIQENRARVVTNPHIAVRNGQTATIALDQDKYVNVLKAQESDIKTASYELKDLKAGVNLEVSPTVTSKGLILLDVKGLLSVFAPSANEEYAIDSNTIETSVNVVDGQTLIIGGMIDRQENQSDSGVPFLKTLPLIGNLFKRTTKETDYFETVIYITPHIFPLKNFEQLGSRNEIPFVFQDIYRQEENLATNINDVTKEPIL